MPIINNTGIATPHELHKLLDCIDAKFTVVATKKTMFLHMEWYDWIITAKFDPKLLRIFNEMFFDFVHPKSEQFWGENVVVSLVYQLNDQDSDEAELIIMLTE